MQTSPVELYSLLSGPATRTEHELPTALAEKVLAFVLAIVLALVLALEGTSSRSFLHFLTGRTRTLENK